MPPGSSTCNSEQRTCTDGVLSGSFAFDVCFEPVFFNCTGPDGAFIEHGDAGAYYRLSSVPSGEFCEEESRECSDGSLSGSYEFPSCETRTRGPVDMGPILDLLLGE